VVESVLELAVDTTVAVPVGEAAVDPVAVGPAPLVEAPVVPVAGVAVVADVAEAAGGGKQLPA
jgi:hypothetical protein